MEDELINFVRSSLHAKKQDALADSVIDYLRSETIYTLNNLQDYVSSSYWKEAPFQIGVRLTFEVALKEIMGSVTKQAEAEAKRKFI